MKIYLIILILLMAGLLSSQDHLVWITANPDTIYFDGNVTFSLIRVFVADDDENPVAGVTVYFDCDIGNILYFAVTNTNGIAETTFWESGDLGVATITGERNGEFLETQVTIIMPISTHDEEIPVVITNLRNYPNPFNPSTTISFETTNLHEFARIEIYNLKGQKIKNLPVILSPESSLGKGSVVWDGTDESNQKVSSGVYYYRIKIGEFEQTKKMMLMK